MVCHYDYHRWRQSFFAYSFYYVMFELIERSNARATRVISRVWFRHKIIRMAWLSSGSKMSEKPTETYLGTSLRKLAPKPDQICRQPRRFHQYPRFESGGSRIATRLYPINLPLGPKRPHSALRRPPALGLGCVWGLKEEDEAPGSTSLPPIQRPKHEEDKQVWCTQVVCRIFTYAWKPFWLSILGSSHCVSHLMCPPRSKLR